MDCPSCKTSNPENAKFCLNCGTPLARAKKTQGERKLVSVLFADVVGSTAMAERLDPEEVAEIMNGAFAFLNAAVAKYGGTVARLMGDAILAFFGAPLGREDDAARAVRAGLEMQMAAEPYQREVQRKYNAAFALRVGINTGLAVLDVVGDQARAEYTAMGDTVNVAKRVEEAAPTGTLLISHETYLHIRGLFEVKALDPIQVKGKSQSLQVYQVLRSIQRTFRGPSRSVAGVDIPIVGREKELMQLEAIIPSQEKESQTAPPFLVIVGEAGIGKSRLIYEFLDRIGSRPERIRILRSRADESQAAFPYALFRALFSFEYDIQDSDSEAIAKEKLAQGIAESVDDLPPDWVPFLGHLIGLDYSDDPALRGIIEDAEQIRDRAFHVAVEFFRACAGQQPTMLLMEDIHWADDGSLDLIEHLQRACSDLPLTVMCTSRRSLFDRRPEWQSSSKDHQILRLEPLSNADTQQLVEIMLKNIVELPVAMRELIVARSEGNPFYAEEVIKMFIEDGVIIVQDDAWLLKADGLDEIRVPSTLRGVIQARVDGLPETERNTLQLASVVGHSFWDDVVARLKANSIVEENGASVVATLAELDRLKQRELVFHNSGTSFVGAEEYQFKHSVLWQVTYKSLLRRMRRIHHAQVAEWLIEQSGDREGQFAGQIAAHFENAAESDRAATWFARAGKQAQDTYAASTAVDYYQRALALWERSEAQGDLAPRLEVFNGLGNVLQWLGRYSEAVATFEQMRAVAEQAGDLLSRTRAWHGCAEAQLHRGDILGAIESARQQEKLARQAGADLELARALWMQAWGAFRKGEIEVALDLAHVVLDLSQQVGDSSQLAHSLNLMGVLHSVSGRFDQAQDHFEQALVIFTDQSNRRRAMPLLNNLGVIAESRGDYSTALERYQQALQAAREIGNRDGEMFYLSNVGGARLYLEDYAGAEADLRQVLAMAGDTLFDALSSTCSLLSGACLGVGKIEDALAFAEQARDLAEKTESQEDLGMAWRALAEVSAARPARRAAIQQDNNRSSRARTCFSQSAEIFRALGRDDELARTLKVWAAVELQSGDQQLGMHLWQEAKEIYAKLGVDRELERMAASPVAKMAAGS